jgi:hypothetical protein
MSVAEARDAFVIGNKRTVKLDGRSDQQPIRRIAIFEMVQPVAAAGRAMAEWHRFDAGTRHETLDPRLDREISGQIN